ncbi:hypothetical protein [Polyangium sp. 15x6]|uniref:hypothetical protein n=1 Tax=Polyangium sp. 15x6 TaxID=3042687 RepID=UPI00249B68E6|nr:hypothetical protein [Polyangium sp. 15x6]MDI3282097.1 hypothetical protein [Polyangium sp. 15x6]
MIGVVDESRRSTTKGRRGVDLDISVERHPAVFLGGMYTVSNVNELLLEGGARFSVDHWEEQDDFVDVIVIGAVDEGTVQPATLTLREGDTERQLRGVARAISVEDRDDETTRTLVELHGVVVVPRG